AGDEGADGADEGGHNGVGRPGDRHQEGGDVTGHAAVAHDLGRRQDGHQGDDGLGHLLQGGPQHLAHHLQAGLLQGAAHKGGDKDQYAGGIDPEEGIGAGPLAGVDHHVAFDGRQQVMDGGYQAGGGQQQHEDQDEGGPGQRPVPDGEAGLLLGPGQGVLGGGFPLEQLGEKDGYHHAHYRAGDRRQLRPHILGGEKLGDHEGHSGAQGHRPDPLQGPDPAAGHHHHQQGGEHHHQRQLEHHRHRGGAGLQSRHRGGGDGGDADGAEGGGGGVGHQTYQSGEDGVEAQA